MIVFVFCLLQTIIPPSYTAQQIYNDYWNNAKKADDKYKNKRMRLTGVVQGRSSNLWHVYLKITHPGGITATIADNQIVQAPAYKPGDQFDMVCLCAGQVFGLPLFLECRVP